MTKFAKGYQILASCHKSTARSTLCARPAPPPGPLPALSRPSPGPPGRPGPPPPPAQARLGEAESGLRAPLKNPPREAQREAPKRPPHDAFLILWLYSSGFFDFVSGSPTPSWFFFLRVTHTHTHLPRNTLPLSDPETPVKKGVERQFQVLPYPMSAVTRE